jgi:hypothetical protein
VTKNGIGTAYITRVKNQKLLADNIPLKKWLKKPHGEENTVVENPPIDVEIDEFQGGQIPEDCFYSDYDEDTLQEIMSEQMKMITLLKSKGKSKHLANRILIIFGMYIFKCRRSCW